MEYYGVREISQLLKVSEYTVAQWLRAGKIKGTKIGGKFWRVRDDDLRMFIKKGEQNRADPGSNT